MGKEAVPRRGRGSQPREFYELTMDQIEVLQNLREPITVTRAADILGQSESSLYNAIDQGRLRSVEYHWEERTMRKLQGRDIIEWAQRTPTARPARRIGCSHGGRTQSI